MAPAAVFVDKRFGDLDAGAARDRAAIVDPELFGAFRREDLFVRLPVESRTGHAERLFGGFICVDVSPLHVLYPGEARKVVHESGEALFNLTQRLLSLFSIGDVDADAVKSYGLTLLRIDGLAAALHPPDAPVGVMKTKLDRVIAVLGHRIPYLVPTELPVIFVYQLEEVFFRTAKLAFFQAKDLFQLFAPRNDIRRDVALPHAHPAALHRQSEHRLIVMDRFFYPLALGDVANDLRRPDDVAFGVSDRRYGQRHDYVGTIPATAYRFEVLDIFLAPDPPEDIGRFFKSIGRCQHGDRLADHFLSFVPEHLGRADVPARDRAHQIFADDRVLG